MALRLSALVIILSSIKLQYCRGGVVLPRPPSSPNEIDHSDNIRITKVLDQKLYNEKTPLFYRQSSQESRSNNKMNRFSNVQEKPNTDNYKLLEIELSERGRDDIKQSAIRFGEILREVLRAEDNDLSVKKTLSKLKSLNKNGMDDEKLYYLKKGKLLGTPDFVTGNKWTSWEPRSYLKSINSYDPSDPNGEKRYVTKSSYRPKKYQGDIDHYRRSDYTGQVLIEESQMDDNRNNTYDFVSDSYRNGIESTDEINTTENYLPSTSSELPKQIPPPPPGIIPSQTIFAHTTPVLRSMSRRTDILPHGLTI